MSTTPYAAAMALAGGDWPVFPLAPRSKLPLIAQAHPPGDPRRGCRGECGRDGHGLHDGTTDAERIAAWWAACPRANIGLRTGVAFDVLDVDVKEANGMATLARLLDEHGCLPAGPSVATPSGGVHFYLRPTGHGNAAGFLPGLDWRGAGGYVVAPPSTVDGKAYEWAVEPAVPLSPAPEWLVALLPAVHRPASTAGPIIRRSASAYARRALESEVGRLAMAAPGQRNHQLNASAYYLGQLVGAGQLDVHEVVETLAAIAERIGLEAGEIAGTIRSGLNKGMAQPRRLTA